VLSGKFKLQDKSRQKPNIMLKKKHILTLLLILSIKLGAQITFDDSLRLTYHYSPDDTAKVDEINRLIMQYAANNPILALQYSDSVIKLSNTIRDSLRLAQSISRKGVAFYYIGDYNSALQLYLQAIKIKEELGKDSQVWTEYNNIALLLNAMGQHRESLHYYRTALKGAEEYGNQTQQAVLWNNIGISLRGIKEFEAAREAYEKSLTISTTIAHLPTMMLSLNNLGNVFRDLGQPVKSVEYCIKALEISKKTNNLYEQANILNNLATSQIQLGELIMAQTNLSEAEQIINAIGSTVLRIKNLTLMSELLIKQKRFENAIEIIEKRDWLKDSLSHVDKSKQFNQIKTIVEAEKKMLEYQMLKQLSQIQQEKIRNARIIQLLTGIVLIIVLVFVFLLLRSNKTVRKLNRALAVRTNQVEELNDELKVANEELQVQRDSLIETLGKLEKSQDKLIQSEKMASLGVLAAGIAHEINNPLNFIQGGVEGIKETVTEMLQNNSSDIVSFLEIIEVGVKRAAAIVSSLSHYSRKEDHINATCDIHTIIDNCLLLLNHRIEGKIAITKDFADDFLTISCNEGKMHQAILHILSNAIDAIKDNGKISIRTELNGRIECLTITDNGCGIPQENMSKLTDPFFTTKDPGKGTGLGLAVALKTVQDLQGSLEFFSEEGKGTIVRINIPVVTKNPS
jgi:signal transduction histidine kinase/Tfp pilus assembly protein PilF